MTTTTCTVHGPTCERIHVGDTVKVVYGDTQLGYGHTGTVIADTDSGHYTVRFDIPVVVDIKGTDFVYPELTYRESELDKA